MIGARLVALGAALLAAAPARARDCAGAPYDCAVGHVQRREFTAAIGLLDQVVAHAPRDLKALNLLGIALTAAGRAEAGTERFRDALAVDPSFYPARKNLGVNAFTAGRQDEARREFEEVLKIVPDDEVAHVHLAEIHFQRGDHAAALPHYERAGARVAQDPSWTLHHAASLVDQRRADKAARVLDALPPGDAASRFEAGVLLGGAGRYADAARVFATARDGYKDPYAAAYNQTLMLIEAGQPADAIRVAEELFASGTRPAELYNLVSRAFTATGRIQEAYDALRTAARLEPTSASHYLDLAAIALDHQNYDLGLEIVDVGLRYLPDSSVLYLQRGVLMATKGDLGPAEKEFETARRLAPDEPVPYAALAMVWVQSGQVDKAVTALREEWRRRPADHVVPYTFAMALMRSGIDPGAPEATEALEAVRAALGAQPDFAPARAELGRLLLRRGDIEGAVRELERAVALDAESPAALYNLSQAYVRKGDRARAAELAARLSRLNARERGDDPEAEMKRVMFRLVREGPPTAAARPRPGP